MHLKKTNKKPRYFKPLYLKSLGKFSGEANVFRKLIQLFSKQGSLLKTLPTCVYCMGFPPPRAHGADGSASLGQKN